MKKLFLLLFSVLAFTSQVRADVDLPISTTSLTIENWDKDLYCSKEWCNILEKGDILYGTVTINNTSDYQIQLQHNYTAINDFTYVPSEEKPSEGKISYTLTAEDVTNLKTDGMRIRGKNYTLTSLYLKKSKSVIKTSIAADGSTGNWANSVDFPENSLTTAVENDYVMVSVTPSDNDAQGKVGMSSKGTDTYGFNSYVNSFYGIVTADMAGEGSKNGYVQGKNITVNSAALYHPINSFKIGSIGMATFSATQEVKVPNGLTAYKATVSDYNVTLTPFTNNVIPANQGAIIVGDEGSVVEFEATSTNSSETSDLLPVTEAKNVSTLAEEGYDLYVLYNNPTGGNIPLSLDDLNCGWGSSYDKDTKTITFEDEWKGRGWGWNFDYSDYSKIVVEFESAPSAGVLKVEYNNEPENFAEESSYSAGATSVEIALNAEKKSSVNQIYLSASTAGTLTLTNAYRVKNSGSAVAEFRKTESGTIAANKAYLKIDSSGNPGHSKLNIVFAEDENKQGEEQQGETNSIRNIANTNVNNNVVYNMNGQRVGSDYKGLVIVNGKKIIKK